MDALCPHCLTRQRLTETRDPMHGHVLRCPNPDCRFPDVPYLYGVEYDQHPPCPVSVVGLAGHGKTVYLLSLIQEIGRLNKQWADRSFSRTWLDEAQLRQAVERLNDLRAGRRPPSTITAFEQPLVLRLSHVPRVGGSQLILFDIGGEAFFDPTLLADVGGYLVRSPAVVWLLSVGPKERLAGPDYPEQMLLVYRQMMAQLEERTDLQDVILVVTKGDELLARPDLPASARAALAAENYNPAGPIWPVLETASDDLEGWLRELDYGNLVNLLKQHFRSVRFCITSAQGTPAVETDPASELKPRGVLAPLLWLWRAGRPPARVGDDVYLSLPEAVAAAPPGGTVTLGDAVYQLPGLLAVRSPVTVVGTGKTVIETAHPMVGIGVATGGRLELRNLTVRHARGVPADVIRVTGGELALDGVTVTGGWAGEVGGRAVLGHGVAVGRQSSVAAVGCTFRGNAGDGLGFGEGGGGTAYGGSFEANGRAGVYVGTTGRVAVGPAASGPAVCRNNTVGVWVSAAAEATLDEVVCDRNQGVGIVLGAGTRPSTRVRGCRSGGNKSDGIRVVNGGSPVLVGNTCSGNAGNGVRVSDAAPELEQTTADGNVGCGLLYEGASGGAARKTTAADNGRDGVRLEGPTGPRLEETDARRNRGYGVAITDPAAKVVFDPAASLLEGNTAGPVFDARPQPRPGWLHRFRR